MQDEYLRGILHNRNGKKVAQNSNVWFSYPDAGRVPPVRAVNPEGKLRRSVSGNLSGQISTHTHYAIPVNYCRVRKNRNVEDLYEKYIGDFYSCRVDSEDVPARLFPPIRRETVIPRKCEGTA